MQVALERNSGREDGAMLEDSCEKLHIPSDGLDVWLGIGRISAEKAAALRAEHAEAAGYVNQCIGSVSLASADLMASGGVSGE